jgi:hypothetical protein
MTNYQIQIGTTPTATDVYNSGVIIGNTTPTVTVPTGVTLYVRLLYLTQGVWKQTTYTF